MQQFKEDTKPQSSTTKVPFFKCLMRTATLPGMAQPALHFHVTKFHVYEKLGFRKLTQSQKAQEHKSLRAIYWLPGYRFSKEEKRKHVHNWMEISIYFF